LVAVRFFRRRPPAKFSAHPLDGVARNHGYVFRKDGEEIEVHPQHTVAVNNDSNARLAAGLAGLGIVRTATFMAAPHSLEPLLLDWHVDPFRFMWSTHRIGT
jgi:DNA-binding transcriptional LysR family regulator